MNNISSSEFILKLKIEQSDIITINDYTIVGSVRIHFDLHSDGVEFANCIFKKSVIFENVNLNCGIKFFNCTFENSLIFRICVARNYNPEFNFDECHIKISKSRIYSLSFQGKNEIKRGIKICNKSTINRLSVKSIISNMGSFAINDSTIQDEFEITDCNFCNSVEIRRDSIIKANVRFMNVVSGSLSFTDSIFEKDIYIWANKIDDIIFNNGIFYEDLKIKSVISNNLTLIGTEFKKSFVIEMKDKPNNKSGSLKSVYIESAKFGEQFKINGDSSIINKFTINFLKPLEGAMHFDSCIFLKAKISGDNHNGNIFFKHCCFNNLSFDFFYNYSTLSIISAKAYGNNSEVSITNSNLGKTHFFDVFFNTFEKITIRNSVLTQIVTANVKWFKPQNLNTLISSTQDDFIHKKEIYRQLKFALEKQGNRIESLNFKSLEMKAYKDELFYTKIWYKKIFSVNRFVLWVGQTNDFGLNWIKPVILALGFGLLFYCLIVIGISEKISYSMNISFESLSTTFDELIKHIYALPRLLNPAHSLEKVFKNYNNFGFFVNFLDYSLKVFLAFFIFQVISAFRKFMK